MSTTKLRTFLAVARQGSFSAGARALGLSQPTVTTQIQALERDYNVELFHRRGRRIELTVVGRPQGRLEQPLALCRIRRRFHQAWDGNTVEQCVESLHRLPPKEKCAAILAFT